MTARLLAGFVASALALLPSAAAAPGSAQIAFTGGDTFDRGDVFVADPTGNPLTNLTPGQQNPWDDDRDPTWSPNGARLAFVSHRDANNTQEIYVMAADGSSPRRLTTDSGTAQIFNVSPLWSPDGRRIAWLKAAGGAYDVWVMAPDGSGQRRLTSDGGQKAGLRWGPDSSRLLYWRTGNGSQAFLVNADTGAMQNLTPSGSADSGPVWSPDGTRIAVTRNGAIWVANADGSGARLISPTLGLAPAWSPDGSRIAFVGERVFPEFGSRFGPAIRDDVYVVGADRGGERRLTGPLGEEYAASPTSGAPSWWPDGTRLFLASSRAPSDGPATTYVMNADGTCEGRFAPTQPRLFIPVWKPGVLPGLQPIACADLRVSVTPATDAVGQGKEVEYRLTIDNDGNLSADGLTLEVTAAAPAKLRVPLPAGSCSGSSPISCRLPSQAPGQRTSVSLYASLPAAGVINTTFRVASDQPDSDPTSNTAAAVTAVLPCTTVGTLGNDAIYGTVKRDVICARTGWDRINALAGNDSIDAGNGNDTVDAGKGRDTILGKGGLDVILARDGERDTIDCGTENDLVLADRKDRVARNCERVLRY